MEVKEKVKEIVMILGMVYLTMWKYEDTILIKPIESDKQVVLKIENDTLVVHFKEEEIYVLSLDRETGDCVLDLEQVLIDICELQHQPLALSMYLYCRLLGILWGIKASPALRNKDPLPTNRAYLELKGIGRSDNTEYVYRYALESSGLIIVTKNFDTNASEIYSFTAKEYLEDPEKTTIDFFECFSDIKEIMSVGRG